MICLPVAFAAFVSLLPDTPYCLLRKGRLDDAEKSLMFYRNVAAEDLASGAPQGLAFVEEFESWKVFVRAEDDKETLTWADFGNNLIDQDRSSFLKFMKNFGNFPSNSYSCRDSRHVYRNLSDGHEHLHGTVCHRDLCRKYPHRFRDLG